jgi:hypothetical protein
MKKICSIGIVILSACLIIIMGDTTYSGVNRHRSSGVIPVSEYKQKFMEEKKSKERLLYKTLKNVSYDEAIAKDIDLKFADYLTEKSYQATILTPAMVTEFYKNNASFDSILTEDTRWFLANRDGVSGHSVYIEDGDRMKELGSVIGGIPKYIPDDLTSIFDKIERKSPEGIEKIQYAYSHSYMLTLIYFSNGRKEYVIPYFVYDEEIGIKNGEVYLLRDLFKRLDKSIDERGLLKNTRAKGAILTNSGITFRNQVTFSYKGIATFALLITSIIGFILLLIRRKKINNLHNT